jgi:glycosyltransferase 2 family protein
MLGNFMEYLSKWYSAWKKIRTSPWWRLGQVGVIAAGLCLMLGALALNWTKIDFSSFRFRFIYFAAALTVGCVPVWLGAFAWAEILGAFCPNIPFGQAIKVHLLSMPMKYLPGGSLNHVSKGVQLNQAGLRLSLIVILIALDVGVAILTGMIVAACILIALNLTMGFLSPGLMSGFVVLLGVIALGLPVLLFELLKKERETFLARRAFVIHFWGAELIDIISWLIHGVTLWLVVGSVLPSATLNVLPYATMVVVTSLIVSLLVVFAPNGIGIREATMFMLLNLFIPASAALAVPVISRVAFVGSELVSFLPVIGIPWLIKSYRTIFGPVHKK